MTIVRTFLLLLFCCVGLSFAPVAAHAAPDPLPSWNDGGPKKAIIAFVTAVSKSGSPQFVRPEDRIATFDNDGTLWPEQPVVEVDFMLQRVAAMAVRNPDLKTTPPYDAILAQGGAALATLKPADLTKVFTETHSGMTEDDFATQVREFFYSARHPTFGVPYAKTVYQPMLELMTYLRANGFKVYLCSGGDIGFMRVFAQELYGIPPENVIGTFMQDQVIENGGRLRLVRQPKIGGFATREGKVSAIARHIGKRPIFVAGNVGNGDDVFMARYSGEGLRPSLQILVNHDDDARELAYGDKDQISLDWAKSYGWQLVSMKSDWKRIFPNGGK